MLFKIPVVIYAVLGNPVGTFRSIPINLPELGEPITIKARGAYKPVTVNPEWPPIRLDSWIPIEFYEPYGYIYFNKDANSEYAFYENSTRPVIREGFDEDINDGTEVAEDFDDEEYTPKRKMKPQFVPKGPNVGQAKGPVETKPEPVLVTRKRKHVIEYKNPVDKEQIYWAPDVGYYVPDETSTEISTSTYTQSIPLTTHHLRKSKHIDAIINFPNQFVNHAMHIPKVINTMINVGAETLTSTVFGFDTKCTTLNNPLCVAANTWTSFTTAARTGGVLDILGVSDKKPFLEEITKILTYRAGGEEVVGVYADEETSNVIAIYSPTVKAKIEKFTAIPNGIAHRIIDKIEGAKAEIYKEAGRLKRVVNKQELGSVLAEPLDWLSAQIKEHTANDDCLLLHYTETGVPTLMSVDGEIIEKTLSGTIDQLMKFPTLFIDNLKAGKSEEDIIEGSQVFSSQRNGDKTIAMILKDAAGQLGTLFPRSINGTLTLTKLMGLEEDEEDGESGAVLQDIVAVPLRVVEHLLGNVF